MTVFIVLGIVLSLAGLAGVLWCIRRAARLKRAELSDDAAGAELGRIVLVNMAAIGTASIGLGLLVIGLLLQ
ncbi:MAG TPA: hypothetical protein VFJ13_12420 [Paracoccaceae bacterium]|nr:hypothetical protein [Paracoccaceae bacterium]